MKHLVHLLRDLAEGVLHLLRIVVLGVFGDALRLLLLLVDLTRLGGAIGVAEGGALRLQLLGERVHLVAEGLQLIPLGRKLLLQVGKIALELVGRGHRRLEFDYGHLGARRGRASGGGGLGCRGQRHSQGQNRG